MKRRLDHRRSLRYNEDNQGGYAWSITNVIGIVKRGQIFQCILRVEAMKPEITFNHVALEYADKDKADLFFSTILGMEKVKSSTLPDDVSDAIFGIRRSVDMEVYDNGMWRVEVFITGNSKDSGYEHTCIEVKDRKEFMQQCAKYSIEPIAIKMGGKDLLFVRDFSNNLFEIKEKQLSRL